MRSVILSRNGSGMKKQRLNRGESFGFEAFNSTKSLLLSVQLDIETDQGTIKAILGNRQGRLHVEEVHSN